MPYDSYEEQQARIWRDEEAHAAAARFREATPRPKPEPLSDAERLQILGTIIIWCQECGKDYRLSAERWSGTERCHLCGSDSYGMTPPTKEG